MADPDPTRAMVKGHDDRPAEGEGGATAVREESYDARRVPAYRAPADPAEGPAPPDGTRVMESAPPATGPARPLTSTDLAQKSQKQRRRDRDQRAEKAAQRVVIGLGLGLGALALILVNSDYFDDEPGARPAVSSPGPTAPVEIKPSLAAVPDETPDLPLFNKVNSEGLTIVAEGLPEVLAIDPPNPPALLAGIQTCRFAYGIWEFSPNHAFRFLSTCAVLDGQVLVGAYEIRGSAIHLSPITSDGTTTISVFEVEKPSRMVSKVSIQPRADGPSVVLEVRQRITGMRPGMDGNAFFRTFASRNTTEIQGMPTRREAGGPGGQAAPREPRSEPKKGGAKDNDPVLELLKGGE